jgi:MYXO-CTERM domain-containing protein
VFAHLNRSTRINRILSVLFIISMGACGNFGGCGACSATGPLPAGGLPGSQTIEGGAQVRVTPTGFDKLTSILPGVVNSGFANGFCIPKGSLGNFALSANYCTTTGGACGGNNGCSVSIGVHPGSFAINATGNTFHFAIGLDVHTIVAMDGAAFGIGFGSCSMHVDGNDIAISADIALGVTPSNGELNIHVAQINNFDSSGLNLSNCGIISSFGNLINSFLNTFIGQFAIQLLTPVIDNLVQGFLPSPLGIASITDVGQLLAGVSPGTKATMETRIVPGGYANLVGNGLSLGIITGLNSDTDLTTRTGTRPDGVPFVSEPALCVPPLPTADFSMPPHSLPTVNRSALTNPASAFSLVAANEFNGAGETGSNVPDIKMGVSETMLDLLGHHLVTSGALCLGVGTSLISQLNVGTIGILVPSLGDLQSDQGNDPLLLVTRPQRAVDFTIGDNTVASPAITIGLSHMEVDFYAFLYERYVRAFTMDLTMNVGINLEFEQQAGMPAMIKPTIVGISSSSVTVSILNSDFVKETPDHLAMVLPSVFDLVTPLLGNLAPIQVPSFAGFTLNNPSIAHVVTAQDNFLAINATLGAGFMARQIAQTDPFMADAVQAMDGAVGVMAAKSTGQATLKSVHTPSPELIRNALTNVEGGKLPEVTFDVDHFDASGRELEWTWNFNGGLWHPWSSASPLVISDRAFAWQGKFQLGLQSRVKGDIHTNSDVVTTEVVIDSVGPKVLIDKAAFDDNGIFTVPAWDIVSGKDVQLAFGRPGVDKPDSQWAYQGDAKLSKEGFDALALGGEIVVWARDEAGNVSQTYTGFHGQSGATGCACQTSGTPGAGSLALFGIVGLALRRRRRRPFSARAKRIVRRAALYLGVTLAISLAPACDCNHKDQACEKTEDCTMCPQGQIPFCIDNTCVCSADIPAGRVGPYSDVGVNAGGTIWVSAYAQSHGDLVVAHATGGRIPDDAWEWVDGVPAGPVTVPGSKIRGGVEDDGPNVGMYTSIAVKDDGSVYVSYFDVDRGALKLAIRGLDGTYALSDVDLSTAPGDPASMTNATGMYTSISMDPAGNPGIAYLAHVADGANTRAEVRYAQANNPNPTGLGDWTVSVVDTGEIPPDDPANPNIYPLPEGLGLFIDSTRDPSGAPVVTYYDRAKGDLKVARWDAAMVKFDAAITLDGAAGVDAGWSPSVQISPDNKIHVAYVNATSDDLVYITEGSMPEIIDNGYRIVGTTVDGLPKPEYHFVGDDAGLVLANGAPTVLYQDATTQELLLATRNANGWTHESIAGAVQPWPGAYGFFASDALSATDLIMSSWVIDQPTGENWVEVFSRPSVIQ